MITQALTALGITKTCSKCGCEKSVDSFYVKRSQCKECFLSAKRQWNKDNKEKLQEYRKKFYAENAESEKERVRSFYADNVEAERNRTKQHKVANRHLYNAQQAKRRASKLNATPTWLTEDDFDVIGWAYEMAKERSEATGVQHHVDHIVPLQGNNVCGLHVWWNLQVIPASMNLRKSNNF